MLSRPRATNRPVCPTRYSAPSVSCSAPSAMSVGSRSETPASGLKSAIFHQFRVMFLRKLTNPRVVPAVLPLDAQPMTFVISVIVLLTPAAHDVPDVTSTSPTVTVVPASTKQAPYGPVQRRGHQVAVPALSVWLQTITGHWAATLVVVPRSAVTGL